jgi:hypothetical protein
MMTGSSSSPYSRARELYKKGELEAVMSFCADCGMVYADSECFFCVYPTTLNEILSKQDISVDRFIETESKKGLDKVVGWYVYVASGNLKRAFSVIPPLDFIAYRRMDKRFRVVSFERMARWQIQ